MFKLGELIKATGARLVFPGRDESLKGISIDSRIVKPGEAFLALKGDNFDGHDFINQAMLKGASCIICERLNFQGSNSKKEEVSILEVRDSVAALGGLARFNRQKYDIPVIAVSGSNGKTTTKEMIAQVLATKFRVLKNPGTKNNHIGLPLTLLNLNSSYDIAVLEVGTNHFGEVDYLAKICLPDIACLTNIGPSHLEFLRDLKGVLKEKYALVKNLKKPCIVLLNSDDLFLNKCIKERNRKELIFSYGINKKSDFLASHISSGKSGIDFKVNSHKFHLSTIGAHNVYNALPAIAIGRIFGIPYSKIVRSLKEFEFLGGRLKFMSLESIKFVDDTYNSNPLSLKEALYALASFPAKGRKIFVMGDMMELGKSQELFHRKAGECASGSCDVLITVGSLSRFAAEGACARGFSAKNIFSCSSVQEAKELLYNKILPASEDVVLVKGSRAMKMEEIFKRE